MTKNIICFSSIDWDFNWQNPQEVASAFAASGQRVLFIENTGVRPSGVQDVRRLWKRFGSWMRARGRVRSLGNGIDVYSPVLIPLPFSRIAGFVNARILLRVIRRWLSCDASRPLLLFTFLPTPLIHDLIRKTKPRLVVYYRIDRLVESSPAARPLAKSEPGIIAAADLVLLSAENLRTDAMHGSRVEILPSGVRVGDFARAQQCGDEVPELAGIDRPIVGFSGSVREQLDVELLRQVIASTPDLNYVFVGPILTDSTRLEALPNVHLIGPMPHDRLIRTMIGFDAGILPYVLDEYTAGIMPAKLKEYLAAGLPIVSTPLPEVCRFARKHAEVIDFAEGPTAFADALRAVVGRNTAEDKARRFEVARQYDWPAQLARTHDLIERLMADTC